MKKIEIFLKSNSYEYTFSEDEIIVKLSKFLNVTIITKNNQVQFEAKTTKWTGFSGFISLKLNKVLRFNTIGLLIIFILGELSKTSLFEKYDYTYIIMLSIALNYLWYFHTLIIYENFKSKIEFIIFNEFEKAHSSTE